MEHVLTFVKHIVSFHLNAKCNMESGVLNEIAFYYALLIQLGAYTCVAFVVLLARLKNFRSPRRKIQDEKYTWFEFIFMGFRILLSSSIGAISILCGMQALLHFPNLPLLAMLPVSIIKHVRAFLTIIDLDIC